ncbi:MAG: guanylate kinase [Nitrospirae bacterium]|nr:MAG: guanylate kinase [Nitrospirota bacterium]
MRGSLFVVSAPSGAGKSTLCNRLIKEVEGVIFSVSYTTRSPRKGEQDGVHYHFVTEAAFRNMIEKGEFLEWAEVHGNLYGTSIRWVEEKLSEGKDVLLDIDVQGALQLREKALEGVYVFILPPSIDALRDRLLKRATDAPEEINKRLENAKKEIPYYEKYDYVIINDILDKAYDELRSVVIASRVRKGRIDREWIEENFSV